MKTLVNYSTYSNYQYGFDQAPEALETFLNNHHIDGVEMLQYGGWDSNVVQRHRLVGNHTCFWPIWLDFWRMDQEKMIEQFGSTQSWQNYYGFSAPGELVNFYRRELERAKKQQVKYVLFHVSHVELEHCYTYQFTYADMEIVQAFIEMINLVLEGFEADFEILFENHWWPGLTFLDNACTQKILEEVQYPKKGLVLDISHLMNTNQSLKTEGEAVRYVHSVLDKMGERADCIRGIHLNSSLSGEYVAHVLKCQDLYESGADFEKRYADAYSHISQIDPHVPFEMEDIQGIVKRINPSYLVYEFSANSLEEWSTMISKQNKSLRSSQNAPRV